MKLGHAVARRLAREGQPDPLDSRLRMSSPWGRRKGREQGTTPCDGSVLGVLPDSELRPRRGSPGSAETSEFRSDRGKG